MTSAVVLALGFRIAGIVVVVVMIACIILIRREFP